ncbi:hypothetical protein F4677DRAFT_464464 [Hypoxylon crocopeplum]|nr:hypothetical protein F4677DRAFT_464464 [Hypoxylon crocopeplum]
MASSQSRVFDTTELLEEILLGFNDRELLVNAQRVSTQWNTLIQNSPRLQQNLFYRAGPKCLGTIQPGDRYVKNPLIAMVLPCLFNLMVRNGGEYVTHTDTSTITTRTLAWDLDADFRPQWLQQGATWRRMQIAKPPITKVFWHITRADEEDPEIKLPGTVAKFVFPDGLRMGDYYDLLVGTKGTHQITWPDFEKNDLAKLQHNLDHVRQWRSNKRIQANTECALLIQQEVVEEMSDRRPSRDELWHPRSLQCIHPNLAKLGRLEVTTDDQDAIHWKYVKHTAGSDSAMRQFLHAAQDPIIDE